MKWQSTPQTTAWVICILHKLWGRYLFFAESGSFSPFWLKFPLIFQNDQVLGNTFRVVCFIFKDGGGCMCGWKANSKREVLSWHLYMKLAFPCIFMAGISKSIMLMILYRRPEVGLKRARKAQLVSLFQQNRIAHLVCSLPPSRTG